MTAPPMAPGQGVTSSGYDDDFRLIHELMSRKVSEVLLVASPYDAYILEEGGSLASKIIDEYRGLNLSRPPRLTHADSPEKALELLPRRPFDLVLTVPHLADTDPVLFNTRIREIRPDLPIIMLAHSHHDIDPVMEEGACRPADGTFIWSGDSDLLLALIKSVEDRLNVDADTVKAMVRILLLVDDSPLYRSFFLPLIYKEVVQQTQAVMAESLNQEHRLLKMRARPKILVAETYEDAMALYRKYRRYIFGVISDTRFPRDCKMDEEAGVRLLSAIKEEIPYLPLLLLSSEPLNREKAERIPAVFIDKNSPHLPSELHDFFLDYLGFGDFVFRLPDGTEVGRAADLQSLEKILPGIPDEPVYYQAQRNRFSNWIMARGEITLASQLSTVSVSDFTDVGEMKAYVVSRIHDLRAYRREGAVAQFSRTGFDPKVARFVKIGHGSLGGKARGLAFMSALFRERPDFLQAYPNVRIGVPRTLVIGTGAFENFIAENRLDLPDWKTYPDGAIADRFMGADLPPPLRESMETFLKGVHCPLSVRSSSLWEDAHFLPYSGLYRTFMLPNSHPDFAVRFRQLATAIKLVYASLFYEGPRNFSSNTARQFRKDAMAVIVQQLSGSRYGSFFYPAVSGIAQTNNFYPVGQMNPEDGVARICLGLGKWLKSGERPVRFCPRYPALMPQFSKVDDILSHAQRFFYALRLSDQPRELTDDESFCIGKREIDGAEAEYPLRILGSTYVPEEHRIRDTAGVDGHRVITFARLLKYGEIPLPGILADLLELGRTGMGCPVEFEFSLNLYPEKDRPADFHLLQMRPVHDADEPLPGDPTPAVFGTSRQSLGHGKTDDISHIAYVKPEAFDPSRTVEIAEEIGRLNRQLVSDRCAYLLVGPGRWGSADRWLGIPVTWKEISGVGAIVELRNDKLKADPSFGSHFFGQITAHNIPYLTITESGEDFFDWEWIEGLTPVQETRYLKLVRTERPFLISSNGKTSEAVLLKGAH